MLMELIPTETEVKMWLISTLQHACHMEYFLKLIGLGGNDPERPHDLVGQGNKFTWEVVKGFALQYRDPKPDFQTYIMPALTLHRQQYHHRMWNEPDPKEITHPLPGSSEDDLMLGAVDAVCSLLENRGYQGGTHDYSSIIEIAKKNPPHKTPWMLRVISEMNRMKQPDLGRIDKLEGFLNIGLHKSVYNAIAERTQEALKCLSFERGYYLR